jgi:uncharacterized membrane protein YccF (DUF307 family)
MISKNTQKNILLTMCGITIFFLGFTATPWQYVGLISCILIFSLPYLYDFLENRKTD